MKTLIHIGYPKCLSTTLQRDGFAALREIMFCGVGVGDNISYCSDSIEFLFEAILKYSSNSFYERHLLKARAELVRLRELAQDRPLVFSSEYLVYNLSPQEIEFDAKLERLAEVIGMDEVEFLLILRKPEDLLRSLYKEYVRLGYQETFSDFVRWFYLYQDRSGYQQLLAADVVMRVLDVFHRAKIHVCFFEEFLEVGVEKCVNELFGNLFDVERPRVEIGRQNPSLSDDDVARLVTRNRKFPRGIGRGTLRGLEEHRNRRLIWGVDPAVGEEELFSDVLAKREALAELGAIEPVKNLFELEGRELRYWDEMIGLFSRHYWDLRGWDGDARVVIQRLS